MLSQQERLTFIAGGLAALRDTTAPAWTQLGLARPKPGVYAELSAAVREMLAGDRITDFFFMHKPPGLRVRFAAGPGRESWVRAEANRLARRWHERGLIDGIVPGVYEPEAFLFGGRPRCPTCTGCSRRIPLPGLIITYARCCRRGWCPCGCCDPCSAASACAARRGRMSGTTAADG
ncbi:lantibiotic dehydratase C-terminal domain-containing protein [Kutzneria kofuensis]|uniref:lantibiotic dehydratase C-terminal domain-containing protein n=1 Tax=Kutzneria kofuensis TaxID=103725 RepID=UPI0031EB47B9